MKETNRGKSNLMIIIIIRHTPNTAGTGSARYNGKKRDRKERTKKGEEQRKNGSEQR